MSTIEELKQKVEFLEISRDALVKMYKLKIDEARALQREVTELQSRIDFFERDDSTISTLETLQRLNTQLEIVQSKSDALNARISSLESQVMVPQNETRELQAIPVEHVPNRPMSIRNRTIARLQGVQRSMSVESMRTEESGEEVASTSSIGEPQVRENRTSRLRNQQIFQRIRSSSACSCRIDQGRHN